MNSPAAPEYFEISDYLGPLRRRWPTVLALALVGLALALGYAFLAPPQYTATVLVQVNALPNNANAVGGRTGGPVNMDNEAQAVRSGAVADIVKSRLRSSLSPAQLAQRIQVTVPPNTTYLQITCAAPTAPGAQRLANTVGQAYLTQRRESTKALIGSGIKALQDRAASLRGTVERLKVLIYSSRHSSKHPSGSPVIVDGQLLLLGARTALTSVQSHIDAAIPLYASLDVRPSVLVGSIVTSAAPPSSPASPRKLLVLPSGLLAGLILGLALAFVTDRRDNRVRSARDVQRLTGASDLLRLPGPERGAITAVQSPRSRAGQAFSELARYVSTALGDGEHVLAVAATSACSSGSVVTANLAVAMARAGSQTAVVCGDLRGSTVPALLGVGRERGLSEVLTGTARVREVAIAVPGVPLLRVITPGLDPSGAGPAMQHGPLSRLIADLLEDARYVIIEVQSVGENAETFSLAEFAETAIVAVQVDRSRLADVTECIDRLARLGAPVLGTAVVPAGPAGPAGLTGPSAAARASGELPELTGASTTRPGAETWPTSRVSAGQAEAYISVADSAPGA